MKIPNCIILLNVAQQHGKRHLRALCHHPTLPGDPPVAEPEPVWQVRGMTEVL